MSWGRFGQKTGPIFPFSSSIFGLERGDRVRVRTAVRDGSVSRCRKSGWWEGRIFAGRGGCGYWDTRTRIPGPWSFESKTRILRPWDSDQEPGFLDPKNRLSVLVVLQSMNVGGATRANTAGARTTTRGPTARRWCRVRTASWSAAGPCPSMNQKNKKKKFFFAFLQMPMRGGLEGRGVRPQVHAKPDVRGGGEEEVV